LTSEQLLEVNPKEIQKAYSHIDQLTKDVFPRFACEILSRFSNFERSLQSLIWQLEGHAVSFNNPLIHAQLETRPSRSIYPDNRDVFLEFVDSSNPSSLHLPLTEAQLKVTHDGELKLYSLEIFSNQHLIVRVHSEEPMVLFIQFLCSFAKNVPVSKLLRALHVPSLRDLKEILETSAELKQSYEELLKDVQNSITNAIRLHLLPQRKL
jgi:hypothetical protein